MVEFNGALYSYVHNLQGDVVGILDNAGSLVVEYKYDAWGKPTLARTLTTAYETLAELNPFRYRGYVYDEEMGLYYLRNRYYNFDFKRFLNEDISLTRNIFVYCNNMPINLIDNDGRRPTPAPVPTITPAPSRPDGWDAEYREQERERLKALEALKASQFSLYLVAAVLKKQKESELLEKAKALNSHPRGGKIVLNSGPIIYFYKEDYWDEIYNEDKSGVLKSLTTWIAGWLGWMPSQLAGLYTVMNSANEYITEIQEDRIDDIFDDESNLGLLVIDDHIRGGGVGTLDAWTENTIGGWNWFGSIVGGEIYSVEFF